MRAASGIGLWPVRPGGVIQIDRMVEFAADVFELHSLVLPRIVSHSYPITLIMGDQYSPTTRRS